MGEQNIAIAQDPELRKLYFKHLLHDVEAIDRMLENNQFESGINRHLPVEDSRGILKGINTKKRLVRYLNNPDDYAHAIAADVMGKNPVIIGPNTYIKYAMLMMLDKGNIAWLVVEGNELIGIITDNDTKNVWEKMKKRGNAEN